MAIASLVLGIIALVFTFIPVIGNMAPILAIIGIVLGVMGKKQLAMTGQPSGTATAGLVLSVIALVISLIFTIICGSCAICASLI
jgi:hypothetical protein